MKEMAEKVYAPQISVIVPVYKVEAYLHRCVDSILAQTFQDFEVLLVDDGSPDRSGEICDEYAKKDKRVRVFHKENGGVSSARNLGIQKANSQYICFVDSDDFVGIDYLNHLMSGGFDFVISGLTYISKGREQLDNIPHYHQANDVTTIGLCIPELEKLYLLNGPCQKRFNRNLLIAKEIRFDENCSNGEDTLFVLEYMRYVCSMEVVSCSDYFYFRQESGTLSSKRSAYQIAYDFARKMFMSRTNMIERFGITSPKYYKYVHLLYIEYLFVSIYSLYYQKTTYNERLTFLTKVFQENKALKFVFDKKIHLRNLISILILKSQNVRFANSFYELIFMIKNYDKYFRMII